MYKSKFSQKELDELMRLNDLRLYGNLGNFSSAQEKIEQSEYPRMIEAINFRVNNGEAIKEAVRVPIHGFIFQTSNIVKDGGIFDRIMQDNIQKQVSGIYTSGRLRYIDYSTRRPLEHDSYDCLHVYEMIDALSIMDLELINKYMDAIPGPSKIGHKYSRLLCNALYSILSKDKKKMENEAEKIRSFNEKSTFDKALLQALFAIMQGDFGNFEESINTMLKDNKKKNTWTQSYLCVQAHAIINLAEYIYSGIDFSSVTNLKSKYWDNEFYEFIKNNKEKGFVFSCDFNKINPLLHEWMLNLPIGSKMEDLISSEIYLK